MKERKGTSPSSVILSALAAAFGVQKKDNLEKDFQYGKPAHYIIAGIGLTVIFITILIITVHWVLG